LSFFTFTLKNQIDEKLLFYTVVTSMRGITSLDKNISISAMQKFSAGQGNNGYKNLGCWRDTRNRSIPTLEGKDPFLDSSYWLRMNAAEKCAQAARKRGYSVFALQVK